MDFFAHPMWQTLNNFPATLSYNLITILYKWSDS